MNPIIQHHPATTRTPGQGRHPDRTTCPRLRRRGRAASAGAGILGAVAIAAVLFAGALAVLGCSAAVHSGPFRSPYYGYSLALPAGWSGRQAAEQWPGSPAPGFEDSNVDFFNGPGSIRVMGYGQAWPANLAAYTKLTLQEQAADHQCPTVPASDQSITIGGAPARLLSMICQGIHSEIAVTVHARSGISFVSDLASATGADRAAFRRFLADIRLN